MENEITIKRKNHEKKYVLKDIYSRTGSDNTNYTNNIFIGNYAGSNFISGKNNIFLGAHAGENETECSNTFILKIGNVELRETITEENAENFGNFIRKLITIV